MNHSSWGTEPIDVRLRVGLDRRNAIAFVSAVISVPNALLSPDFEVAMRLSDQLDIRARDILEFKRQSRHKKP